MNVREVEPPNTIPRMLRASTDAFGARDLLSVGDDRMTYRDLDERSAEIAEGLLTLGVSKGTRVGVLLPNGVDFVACLFAVTRLGAVFVSFNTFTKPDELVWQLRNADVHTLIVRDRFLSHDYIGGLARAVPELSASRAPDLHLDALPTLRRVVVAGSSGPAPSWALHLGELAPDDSAITALRVAMEATARPADDAVVIYTSGSTARPKGVIHTQGTVTRHPAATNHLRGLTKDDRIYVALPLFWVAGLSHGLIGTYAEGACLVVDEVFEPGRALESIERERVTLVSGWPFHGQALADHPDYTTRDLRSLRSDVRNLLTPPDAVVELRAWPSWVGMTECFGAHLLAPMNERLPEHLVGSFGTTVPGFEHRVVDASGEPVAVGETGELLVRGPAVMRGYVGREREETFDPDGFFRTGDVGHFSQEGHFFLEGRVGDVIKTSGTNVSPTEVAAILEDVDGVAAAHVVGIPDHSRGEVVVVALVARAGADLDLGAARAAARQRLSGFKVPRHLFAMTADEVPMTATGKVSRGQLRDLLAERVRRGDDQA